VQEHRDARNVKRAADHQEYESAHMLPQFLSRLNPSLVSARQALTILLPKEFHKIFDSFWKEELNRIRNDADRAASTRVIDWIQINDEFWSKELNPALKAKRLPTLTERQISTVTHILFEEMVIRSGKRLTDLLIME
jgi:hypothetical protein